MRNFVKILLLLFLASTFVNGKQDSIFTKVENLPAKKKLEYYLAQTWKQRAENPSLALKYGERAIELAKEIDDKSNLAKAYNFVGVIYRNIGEYDISFNMYEKALKIASSIRDSVQIAYAYNNIGGYYGYQHKYFLALEYIYHAREIFKKLHNLRGIAFCNIQAGLWYLQLEQYDLALKELNKTIEIREKIGDKFGISIAKALIDEVYYKKGEYEKAYRLAIKLLDDFRKFNNKKGIGTTLGTLGGIAFHKGDYKQALAYRREALEYLREIKYWNGVVNNLNGLGLIYHKLHKDDEAIQSLKCAISIAKKYNYAKGLVDSYLHLAKIYGDNNNRSKLREYHNRAIEIKDSLDVVEKETRLKEFQKILATNELNKQNLILENELSRNRMLVNIFLLFGVIIFVFVIVFYLQFKKIKRSEKLLKDLNFAKDKLFSIVAHDLKSPFSALLGYSEMVLSDYDSLSKEELKDYIVQIRNISQNLFAMVENLLDWARSQTSGIKHNPEIVEVNKEIEKVANYFAQNAASKNITINTEFEGELKAYCDVSMLQTVLRNLVNNAIKFTRPGGNITIKTESQPDKGMVKISVTDTGLGMTQEQIRKILNEEGISTMGTDGEKGTGLGMILVKEMVKHNGGELFIESEIEKGTTVSFTIPLCK